MNLIHNRNTVFPGPDPCGIHDRGHGIFFGFHPVILWDHRWYAWYAIGITNKIMILQWSSLAAALKTIKSVLELFCKLVMFVFLSFSTK